MTAPTFKTGDRMRSGDHVGTVDEIYAGWLRISGNTQSATWSIWDDPAKCVICPPMSPEAKMVWHAMRAGAKRTARIHITSMNGTCYRVRQYTSGSIALRVEIALPPLAEDEARR